MYWANDEWNPVLFPLQWFVTEHVCVVRSSGSVCVISFLSLVTATVVGFSDLDMWHVLRDILPPAKKNLNAGDSCF